MADKTIPQLQEATSVAGDGLLVIDTGIETYKVKRENISSALVVLATPAMSPITATKERIYHVDTTGSVTIALPASPIIGTRVTVVDMNGHADVARITVTATPQIEGSASPYYCESAFGSWCFEWNGVFWKIVN